MRRPLARPHRESSCDLGPLGDLLVLVLRLVRTRLGHAAAHSLQDEEKEQPQAPAQDRVRGELVLGRAILEHVLHVRQAAPHVEAREEEAELLETVDAGAGREGAAEEDHEEKGDRGQGLHELQRQSRVEPEEDEGDRDPRQTLSFNREHAHNCLKPYFLIGIVTLTKS